MTITFFKVPREEALKRVGCRLKLRSVRSLTVGRIYRGEKALMPWAILCGYDEPHQLVFYLSFLGLTVLSLETGRKHRFFTSAQNISESDWLLLKKRRWNFVEKVSLKTAKAVDYVKPGKTFRYFVAADKKNQMTYEAYVLDSTLKRVSPVFEVLRSDLKETCRKMCYGFVNETSSLFLFSSSDMLEVFNVEDGQFIPLLQSLQPEELRALMDSQHFPFFGNHHELTDPAFLEAYWSVRKASQTARLRHQGIRRL